MQELDQSSVIAQMRHLRDWEKTNIPMYGSLAGYQLFLELAQMPYRSRKSLKEIYLSMNCAESTTRLLFRNLESDGWLQLPRLDADQRFREFQLTEKFHRCVDLWLEQVGMLKAPSQEGSSTVESSNDQ